LGFSNWPVIFYFINSAPSSFLAPLPGIEEEEAPTSNTRFPINLAPSNSNQVFWRRCRGGRRLLRGEFSHAHPLLCFKFCSTLFLLASFYQKYKKISSYYSFYFYWSVIVFLYHAFYQWLVSLKLNLFGKVGSRKSSKIIMRNTACHKKGNTYRNKSIDCISLLETCALLIMLLIALINLVAVCNDPEKYPY
jgi:hypothetical protein